MFDKILCQSLQVKDGTYPVIETLDKRTKRAKVRINSDTLEDWTVHLVLPESFEQCIVDDVGNELYVVKNAE